VPSHTSFYLLKAYDLAEKKAREAKLGLWADDAPVEPSQFRHKK